MPVKILMVCLGNICRSPIAEGLLMSKLPESQFIVDSCGTGDWHIGNQPDPRSIAVCKKNGLDISNQKSRQITLSDFENFDYIYVMDQSNYQNVIALSNEERHRSKVKLILTEKYLDEIKEVPDPYYGRQEDFENVFHLLFQACEEIAKNLKSIE